MGSLLCPGVPGGTEAERSWWHALEKSLQLRKRGREAALDSTSHTPSPGHKSAWVTVTTTLAGRRRFSCCLSGEERPDLQPQSNRTAGSHPPTPTMGPKLSLPQPLARAGLVTERLTEVPQPRFREGRRVRVGVSADLQGRVTWG